MQVNFPLALIAMGVLLGLIGAACELAAHSVIGRKYRIGSPAQSPPKLRNLTVAANGAASALCYVAAIYLCLDLLVGDHAPGFALFFGEVATALLLYDFLYYWMHRALHRPTLMRLVHGIHHRVHHPSAADALYVNPFETVAAMVLFFCCIASVGPVSMPSFIAIALVHSVVNIATHVNFDLPHPAFRLTNDLARRHHLHHGAHRDAHFSSIFPYWDMAFGTYR